MRKRSVMDGMMRREWRAGRVAIRQPNAAYPYLRLLTLAKRDRAEMLGMRLPRESQLPGYMYLYPSLCVYLYHFLFGGGTSSSHSKCRDGRGQKGATSELGRQRSSGKHLPCNGCGSS